MTEPVDEGAGGTDIDPVESADDLLRDERGVVVRDTGVVVTHAVTPVGDAPVRFQLVDPLPSKFDVDEIDFHPDYEPPHGRIDAHAAVVSGVVEPGGELVVRYGLRPSRRRRPAAVEEFQRATRPSIELSEPVDPADVEDVDLDAASMSRGASRAEATDAATEGFYFGIKRLVFGADAEEATRRVATSGGEEPSAGRDDRTGPGSEGADGGEPDDADETAAAEERDAAGERDDGGDDDDEGVGSTERRVPGGDPFGGTNDDASLAASISEIESSVGRSSRDVEAAADDDDEARPFREFFEVRRKDEQPGETATGPAGPGASEAGDDDAARAVPDDADVVGALVRQLEAGEVPDDQRRALGEALSDLLATAERPSKSTEVRLRELESKLAEFAVYSNALEEVIDVHGPADEFLDAVREDIEQLDAAVDDVRGDIAQAARSRAGLDDRLESAADEVALLDSRVARLRNRVDDLEVSHESAVGAIEAEVESLESELERLDRVEEELAALRRAVEDGRARRRAVVDALREDEPAGP